MLLALLYTDDDYLAAAAPACDQQPLGHRYWSIDGRAIDGARGETAYVQIDDPQLCRRLLAWTSEDGGDEGFADGREAAYAVDVYLGLAGPRITHRAA